MIHPLTDLNSWPLRSQYDPILKTTNEAIEYARLIFQSEKHQKPLTLFRQQAIRAYNHENSRENPDYDRLFALAVRGQFYRECLEEVERIKMAQPGYPNHTHLEVTNA